MKSVFILLTLGILFYSCSGEANNNTSTQSDEKELSAVEYYGNTQGTTYAIICNDPVDLEQNEVADVLSDFDDALSGYISTSVISNLNNAPAGEFAYEDEYDYFNRCYSLSQEVYALTEGAFDPTVYPLVDGWGFMKDIENVPDSAVVDSLRALVGFQNGYHFNYLAETDEAGITKPLNKILKNTPNAKLDFNAVAQGLAVDVLAEKLESLGAKNYFVEIGGEIRVSGKNADSEFWRIGIDKPIANSTAVDRELQDVVQLENKSIATSGSYRKFYEKNGVKYSHTLNPKTGYPVTHSLLSATVIAETCGMADAMATAFMVMGHQKAISFMENHSKLKIEVYLIYVDEYGKNQVYTTPGFSEML